MNNLLFFILLFSFVVIYVFIGKKASSKTNHIDDYFLGDRKIGILSLTLTLLATQLGGGALLGAADEAYLKGWSVIFYPIGMSLGLIALSLGFGRKLKNMGLSTVAEIFEKVYKSKKLRQIVSLISIVTLFFILSAQGIAARKFFLSIGFDHAFVFLGFWVLVIFYTVIGGLKGVINTDIVKTIFILGTLIFVFIVAKNATIPLNISGSGSIITKGNIPWVGWLLMPMLFMVIEQDMGQRCFAAKNAKTVTVSGIIASVVLFFCCSFAIYFGVLAKKFGMEIGEKGVLMTSVFYMTGPTVSTIFSVAVLMVVVSTADSLLCSIASNIAFDFSKLKNVSSKNKLIISKVITLVVGVLAMLCSYLFDNVLPLLIKSYEFSVSILFVPIAMSIFLKRASFKSCVLSMSLGAFGFVIFRIWPISFPKEIITLLLSFIGFFIPMIISEKEEILETGK